MKVFSKTTVLLILLFTIGFIFRTYRLSEIPVGLHGDEASIGYNAYSILKTGKDQNGNFLPIAIDQFGDFRPAGYHYITVPFIWLFGLNENATRLPAALFGSLSIIAIYFLASKLFNNRLVGIVSAGLLALTPWHINISRATSESILASFFILLGTYCVLTAFDKEKINIKYLVFTFVCFFLSFLFYHAARFFVPFFIAILSLSVYFNFRKMRRVKAILFVLNLSIITSLLLLLIVGKGANRPLSISIFNSTGPQLITEEQIREDNTTPPLITRSFHNKVLAYVEPFINNYFEHFTGGYLFTRGGFPPRYIIPGQGNFYTITIIFFIVGFVILGYKGFSKNNYYLLLPIGWLLLSPLPAALTFEDIPNVQRASMMIPAYVLITAFGFSTFLNLPMQKSIKTVLLTVLTIVFIYNNLSFIHSYFSHTFTHRPWYRSYGEKELVASVSTLTTQYEKVVMTSQNDNNIIYYLFYGKVDPAYYQSLGSPRDKDGLMYKNIIFTYKLCPLEKSDKNGNAEGNKAYVYVNLGECKPPENTTELKTIKRPDGTTAFRILKLIK